MLQGLHQHALHSADMLAIVTSDFFNNAEQIQSYFAASVVPYGQCNMLLAIARTCKQLQTNHAVGFWTAQ